MALKTRLQEQRGRPDIYRDEGDEWDVRKKKPKGFQNL
jgi:hypothetical protein